MKKILIPLLAVFLVGCSQSKDTEVKDDVEKPDTSVEERIVFDETEHSLAKYEKHVEEKGESIGPRELELAYMETMDLYDKVDKDDLKYIHDNNLDKYVYESVMGLAYNSALQDTKPTNNKKYKEVLQAFSFYSEVIPINKPYDDVLKLIDKVLPDGYEKVKENDYTQDVNVTVIHYTSEKGDFMVSLPHGTKENQDGSIVFDKEIIAGISYYIEI